MAGLSPALARAAAPEIGRCVKVAGTGAYHKANCTTTSPTHTGKYEWEPGLAAGGFTLSGNGLTLRTSGLAPTLGCGSFHGSGSVSGPEELTGITLRLTGCKEGVTGEPKCTTPGLSPGEVETTALVGRFGFISHTPVTVGLELDASLGEPFAVLGCPRGWSSIWGGVITKVKINHMASTQALEYKDVHERGNQQYQQLEGSPPDFLHMNSAEGSSAAIEDPILLTFEEQAEINSVV